MPRTFLGSACPGQLVTDPRWRGLENARMGLLPLITNCVAESSRFINSLSWFAVGKEVREHKARQTQTTPRTHKPKETRGERKHKRKPQEKAKHKTKPRRAPEALLRCVADSLHFLFTKKTEAPTRHDVDVVGDLLDSSVDREHLADGGLRLARCRHLESTRRPQKTKKTKKRK